MKTNKFARFKPNWYLISQNGTNYEIPVEDAMKREVMWSLQVPSLIEVKEIHHNEVIYTSLKSSFKMARCATGLDLV